MIGHPAVSAMTTRSKDAEYAERRSALRSRHAARITSPLPTALNTCRLSSCLWGGESSHAGQSVSQTLTAHGNTDAKQDDAESNRFDERMSPRTVVVGLDAPGGAEVSCERLRAYVDRHASTLDQRPAVLDKVKNPFVVAGDIEDPVRAQPGRLEPQLVDRVLLGGGFLPKQVSARRRLDLLERLVVRGRLGVLRHARPKVGPILFAKQYSLYLGT